MSKIFNRSVTIAMISIAAMTVFTFTGVMLQSMSIVYTGLSIGVLNIVQVVISYLFDAKNEFRDPLEHYHE